MKKRTMDDGQWTKDLSVNIAGIKLKNPVMCASGTFGFGEEYSKYFNIKTLGAIVTKTITLKPRQGNPPPRIKETPDGMLNSIGLQNPGIDIFIKEKMSFLRSLNIPVIVSVAGETENDYAEIVGLLGKVKGVSGIELNLSCPNVKHFNSKLMFSQDVKVTSSIVKSCRRKAKLPIIAKLSPNVTDIRDFAKAAEDNGADALSLINTPIGMAVDIQKRIPCLKMIKGGLSGPAIKPIALRMVWEVYNTAKIPIIGMGGIMSAEDAIEFIICGASAVAIGTCNFINPVAIPEIIKGMQKYLDKYKIKNTKSLTGSLKI